VTAFAVFIGRKEKICQLSPVQCFPLFIPLLLPHIILVGPPFLPAAIFLLAAHFPLPFS
jgi:hypothetical protein